MALLKLEDLCKSFDGQPAVQDLNLELARGQILCLLGPSGGGKTPLLRRVAGRDTPDRGITAGRADEALPSPACSAASASPRG